MSTIIVRAPRAKRGYYAVMSLLFLAFLVGSEWAWLTDHSVKHRVEAVIIFGVFWGGWLVLSLRGLAASCARYEVDEVSITRSGWLGRSGIRWDEIARYGIRRWGGDLTYLFYDREGRRRTSIDFQILARAGEPLFELLMRKLPEVLPGQEHPRPVLPHLRKRGKLPEDPAERVRALRRRARAQLRVVIFVTTLGLFLGIWPGKHVWLHTRLVSHGLITSGQVTALRPNRVRYSFSPGPGQIRKGSDPVSMDAFRQLRVGAAVAVRYLPGEPRVHELVVGIRHRVMWSLLAQLAVPFLGMVGLGLLSRRRTLSRLRALEQEIAGGSVN